MTDGVRVFLAGFGMTKYYDMFKTKGFDDESDIPHLTTYDLEDTIMVSDQADRATILAHARVYRPSTEHALYQWLSSNSLSYYFISFIQSELTDLRKIAQLSLPSEELYDELEIILPGHRKRLERAVQMLKLELRKNAAAETPVTHGWWGKPECLPQAKFDFLCVRASLYSPLDPHTVAKIDFMVDSGSDVSTVQESTLKKLNLDLIGPVYSCGIHGGNHTNLYKGRLRIGDQEMDIEVLGSNYDSLGSRVVRHFRHVIDGHQHIWLKGNYTDPLPAILPITLPVPASAAHSSHQKTPLPIMGGDSIQTDLSQMNIEERMTHSIDVEDVSSEKQPSLHTRLSSISNEITNAEHSQSILTGAKLPKSGSEFHNSQSVLDKVSMIQNPPSPVDIPSSKHRHSAFKGKGKLGTKSDSSGAKSSKKRVHGSSKLRSSKEFSKRFIYSKDDASQLSLIQPQPNEITSDSLENSGGRDTSSDSSVSHSELVSLSNTVSPHIRDTDDDIDHLEGVVSISELLQCKLKSSQVSEHSPMDVTKSVNVETQYSNGPLQSFYNLDHSQMFSPQHGDSEAHNDVKNDTHVDGLTDIVHIDGLCDENTEDDDENSDASGSTEVGETAEKVKMSFIFACEKITVIPIDEMESITPVSTSK